MSHGTTAALIAHFQCGLPKDTPLVAAKETSTDPSVNLYRIAGPRFSYIGESVSRQENSEWMLALRHKRTGELSLLSAEVVSFRPDFSELFPLDITAIKEEEEQKRLMDAAATATPSKEGFIDARRSLGLEFGSKQKKRSIRTIQKGIAEVVLKACGDDNCLKSTMPRDWLFIPSGRTPPRCYVISPVRIRSPSYYVNLAKNADWWLVPSGLTPEHEKILPPIPSVETFHRSVNLSGCTPRRLNFSTQDQAVAHDVVDGAASTSRKSATRECLLAAVKATIADEEASIFPKFNAAATAPVDVYDIVDIVPLDTLAALQEEGQKFADATISELKELGFTQTCVLLAERSPLEPQLRFIRSAQLVYLDSLYKLYRSVNHVSKTRLTLADLRKIGIPACIEDTIFRTFAKTIATTSHRTSSTESRSCPAALKDKILMHIVLLNLLLNGYSTPLASLALDLQLTMTKLESISRALGCSISTDRVTTIKTAVLKGPPKQTEPRINRKRKR